MTVLQRLMPEPLDDRDAKAAALDEPVVSPLEPARAPQGASPMPICLAPKLVELGRVPYPSALESMRVFAATRDAGTRDQIWLLEHPAVYTLGQAGRIEHLLEPGTSIPVVQVERGGQITYHGPGQAVAYTLIDLRRRDLKIRQFVALLEGAMIDTLKTYNVKAERRAGAPGLYVSWRGITAKIAALGLKVKNGATFHGVALNVDMDLEPFQAINPCGYPGLVTVDMASLGVTATRESVARVLGLAIIERIETKDWS